MKTKKTTSQSLVRRHTRLFWGQPTYKNPTNKHATRHQHREPLGAYTASVCNSIRTPRVLLWACPTVSSFFLRPFLYASARHVTAVCINKNNNNNHDTSVLQRLPSLLLCFQTHLVLVFPLRSTLHTRGGVKRHLLPPSRSRKTNDTTVRHPQNGGGAYNDAQRSCASTKPLGN